MCDGVCLSEVWEGVYTNRLLTVPEYVESALLGTACLGERSLDYNCVWGDQDCEWKEEKVEVWDTNRDAFLARTANCVFMNDRGCKRAALQSLFCVPQVSSTISLSANSYSDVELIQVLIKQCHCYPSALYLSYKCIYTSTLWERQKEFLPLLTKFFTRLSHLHIVDSEQYDEHNMEYFGVFRFILEAVFGNREPALTHLNVECCETVMIKAMSDLADFVSSQSGTVAEFTYGSLTTQYSRLKVLSLAAWDDSEDEPEQISIQLVGGCCSNLRQIIEHQVALRSIHISGWFNDPVCPEYDQLMYSLSLLYQQPTFFRLDFKEILLCPSSGNLLAIFKTIRIPVRPISRSGTSSSYDVWE